MTDRRGRLAVLAVAIAIAAGGRANGQAGPEPKAVDPGLLDALRTAYRSEAAEFQGNSEGLIPQASNELMLLVGSADARSVRGLTIAPGPTGLGGTEGKWRGYEAPGETRVVPLLVSQEPKSWRPIGAPGFSGPKIVEVAVFDGSPQYESKAPAGVAGGGGGQPTPAVASVDTTGRWVRQPLRKPVDGVVVPVESNGAIIYRAGREVLAYHHERGWQSLGLSADRPVRFQSTAAGLLVQDGEVVHAYAGGRWVRGDVPERPPAAK